MFKSSFLSRRAFLAASSAMFVVGSSQAHALTENSATNLVAAAVDEINRIIVSKKNDAAKLSDFESVFRRYGDVQGIALTTLGPARRGASAAQQRAYVNAFRTYFTRKYGRRFREFTNGRIEIYGSRPSKSYVEVRSNALVKGQQTYKVFWRVSDRSGSPKIQNMIIGGINVLTNERNAIRSMLGRAKGDVDKLTARLIELS